MVYGDKFNRCRLLACSSTPWPFVLEEFAWAASMVLTRSFLISVPDSDGSRTELESSLMLLPVGDLFNHGAQVSRLLGVDLYARTARKHCCINLCARRL